MSSNKLTPIFAIPMVLIAFPAEAYIGPGAGAGAIAVVLGILASIVLTFFAILWYPIKRILKKRKTAAQAQSSETETSEGYK